MSLPEPRSPEEKLPADSDLQVQAMPRHGIPSHDRDPAAQLPLPLEDSEREAQSVLVGGGLIAGAAVGAAIGVMVSGPVGVVVGAGIGAVAGAAGAVNNAASDQQALQDPGR